MRITYYLQLLETEGSNWAERGPPFPFKTFMISTKNNTAGI